MSGSYLAGPQGLLWSINARAVLDVIDREGPHTLANRAFVTYVTGSFLLQLTFALLQAGIPFFTKYALGEAGREVTVPPLGAAVVRRARQA
ncbi:hypothetical protein [Microbispora rosea]|uniref:hypothetical protein n=1 Tax=Microbispora rosea TaxID=58117 RepID=UPI00341921D7